MKAAAGLLLLFLVASVSHAADVDWNGWSFDYSSNNNSSGLVLTNVTYEGKKILGKVSMPVMRVQYENDVCGPYADILSTGALRNPGNGAQIPACNNQAVCRRTFAQNGENMLEVGANWQIGEYQIYQTYYFSENGYFDSRVYSRGLQCQIQHNHHGQWMFDFDIDGESNDQIAKGASDVQLTEFNDLKTNTNYWTVQDKVTGSKVRLVPSASDGEPTNFAKWDLAGRAFVSSEVGRWRNGARGEIGNLYNTPAQNIDGTDIVLWYVTHLPHSPEEGASIWHASGPRVQVLAATDPTPDPEPEPEPEPEPDPDPEPTPVNNVLQNGGFESASLGAWSNCGSADDVEIVTSNQAAGSRAVKVVNGGCIYQEVAAQENDNYELSCSASRTGNRWTVMQLSYLDSSYQSLFTEISQISTGAGYSNYTLQGVAPAGTAFVAALMYSEDTTYFDVCSLSPSNTTPSNPEPDTTPAPTPDPALNLLANGDFENNLNSWNSCSAANLVEKSSDADAGTGALAARNGGCMYQEFAIEPGSAYAMDCRAKSEGPERYTSVSLTMMNASYAALDTAEIPVVSTAYNNYAAQLSAPAGSQYGSVVVYSEDIGVFDNCTVSVQ